MPRSRTRVGPRQFLKRVGATAGLMAASPLPTRVRDWVVARWRGFGPDFTGTPSFVSQPA